MNAHAWDGIIAIQGGAKWQKNVEHIRSVQEKVEYISFGHNFCECRPIFKILSLTDSQENSLCSYHRDFHLI